MTAPAIPKGRHTITPQLAIAGTEKAIDFHVKAFGAGIVDKAIGPRGSKVWHAALRIASSVGLVNDVFPDMGGSASHSSLWP